MQNEQQVITAVAVVNLNDRTQYYLQVGLLPYSNPKSGLTASIIHMSFSHVFNYLYCIQSNGSITVYNAATSFSLITTLSLGTPICCALIRDTIVYACSTEGELLILDMKTNSGFRRMYYNVPMEVGVDDDDDDQWRDDVMDGSVTAFATSTITKSAINDPPHVIIIIMSQRISEQTGDWLYFRFPC